MQTYRILLSCLLGLFVLMPQARAQDEKPADASYSVVILGDTHYDAPDPDLYHTGYTDPNPKREALHRREFVRNGKMWQGRSRQLVERASRLVGADTKMVLQMGDLIQGDTPDSATHVRFLDDAMNLFKSDVAPDLPFVTVPGNHDLRGNDDNVATKAYTSYMPVRMSRELGQEITGNNYLYRIGPDAFVVIKFTKPDVSEIERLLNEAKGSRHIFLVTHGPVFPYDNSKYYWWFLLGNRKDSHASERRRIRKLLAENEVIVLCGHTHATEFIDWYGDGGRITQMTMSSVWSSDEQGSYNVVASGPEEYCTRLYDTDPSLKTEANQALFDEFRADMKTYIMASSAGSYKLIVDGAKVYVDFYAGDSEEVSHRFILR
ncbi:MAG: metallophosphoesterase [Bacteroidales bacterium]|nr:metallophosphoesterase [Bacteroidales bacterium]